MVLRIKIAKKPKPQRKVAREHVNALVKTTAAHYIKTLKNVADCSHKKGNSKMAASVQKPRPDNVPEEKVHPQQAQLSDPL